MTLYKLQDLVDATELDGWFYGTELVRINKNEFHYTIKSIKKRKGNRLLVNFHGYPENLYQWIDKKDLKQI